MKGDVWEDGSPNPLVVKCPICGCTDIGTRIGTAQVAYHCRSCHHAWFARGDEAGTTGPIQYSRSSTTAPSYSTTTHYYGGGTECVMDNYSASVGRRGWVCPKCGRVYAPDVQECFACNYDLANTKASGQTNQSPSTETRPQDVMVTMNTQEKRVREDGSLVIDKSWFPNLTKDSTVYAGAAETNWRKAMECEHCNQEGGANSNTSSK